MSRFARGTPVIGQEFKNSDKSAVLQAPSADCFRQIVEQADSAVLILDSTNRIVYWNLSAERLTGFSSNDALGQDYFRLLVPEADIASESVLVHGLYENLHSGHDNSLPAPQFSLEGDRLGKGGGKRWTEIVYSLLNGDEPQVAVVLRDLDARKKREQHLLHQAATDDLTQLANRREFQRCLEALVAKEECGVALAIVDIDRFKQINDRNGHAAGDEAMIGVAAKLREFADAAICVGRLGGDEFGALLAQTNLPEATEQFERLCHAIATDSSNGDGPLTVSIGVAVATKEPVTARELLTKADALLYQAKSAGRNQVHVAEL